MTSSVSATLTDIIKAKGRKFNVPDLTQTADELSNIAHKIPAWSSRYLTSIINEKYLPSKRLTRAINVMAATLDDVPMLAANTEPISVQAVPGNVRPGSIILGKSIPCINPLCPIFFVPTVPWQFACCPACRPSNW